MYIENASTIPVRYSMTAAIYTGAPAPIRKWWVIPFKYRRIRATGKSTPAFADLDVGFFFFAPLADILLHCQQYLVNQCFSVCICWLNTNANKYRHINRKSSCIKVGKNNAPCNLPTCLFTFIWDLEGFSLCEYNIIVSIPLTEVINCIISFFNKGTSI